MWAKTLPALGSQCPPPLVVVALPGGFRWFLFDLVWVLSRVVLFLCVRYSTWVVPAGHGVLAPRVSFPLSQPQ